MSGLDFDTIITGLKAAQTVARTLISAEQAIDKAELKLRIADVVGKLSDAQSQIADMKDMTYRLADELDETKKLLKFAGHMKFERPFYWNVAEGAKDGPYCPTCWDSKKSAIRLQQGYGDKAHWQCNVCKFTGRSGPPPPSPEPGGGEDWTRRY